MLSLMLLAQVSVFSMNPQQEDDDDFYVVNYKFNYSKMRINGQWAKRYVFANIYNEEENSEIAFDKFKKRIETTFIKAVNYKSLENHGYTLDNSKDSRYTIAFYFLDVDEDGEHIVVADIQDKENENDVVETVKAKAGSGRFNSFLNLFLERLQKSGERIGDKLAEELDDLR